MKKIVIVSMALILLGLAGCIVAPAGPGCEWVPGHFGPYGGWVRGHCA